MAENGVVTRRSRRKTASRDEFISGQKYNDELNRIMYEENEREGLLLVRDQHRDRSLITARKFKKGELIAQYRGEIISHEEARRREDEYAKNGDGVYIFYAYDTVLKKRIGIDATSERNCGQHIARYANGCCEKYATAKATGEVFDGVFKVVLRAKKELEPKTHIEYCYSSDTPKPEYLKVENSLPKIWAPVPGTHQYEEMFRVFGCKEGSEVEEEKDDDAVSMEL